MKCKCTNYIIDCNGCIDKELSSDYTKHAGCWCGPKHLICLRPKVFRYRCYGHTPKERNKYIIKIISHELGHELYNNHNYTLKDLNIPVIKTDYAKSYRKFDKNLYKEEVYADSIGLYVASTLYPDTENILLAKHLYRESCFNYYGSNKILIDY